MTLPDASCVALPVTLIAAVPVRLVTTPEAGVPRAGVVSVGEVSVLFVRVWESVRVATTEVSMAREPELVIGPPVSPVPLPTLVTVPPPPGVPHVLSPRRKVEDDGVPVALRLVMPTMEFAKAVTKLLVPLPVTAPVRVMVWSPVFAPEIDPPVVESVPEPESVTPLTDAPVKVAPDRGA